MPLLRLQRNLPDRNKQHTAGGRGFLDHGMNLLSPDQKSAVERTNQDVCVVAGPGSGKTRVLIARFAWLVEFHQVDPARILAITFTDKAATEIKERLIKRLTSHREEIEQASVSTIDAFSTRLLQEHTISPRIPPNFTVLAQPS